MKFNQLIPTCVLVTLASIVVISFISSRQYARSAIVHNRRSDSLWQPSKLTQLTADTKALSFIYNVRNDNYAGNSKLRLKASLTVLLWGLQEYGLDCESEIIIVDWGSEVPMWTTDVIHELTEKHYKDCTTGLCANVVLRILHVTPEVAQSLTNHSFVSEVHGWNAAARRSQARFMIGTDQDTLIGVPVFQFLKQQKQAGWPLLSTSWYTGRRITTEQHVQDIFRDPIEWIKNPPDLPTDGESDANGNGATGAFAAPRLSWELTRGFDETMTRWGHMHVEYVPRLNRLHQSIEVSSAMSLKYPFYHMWHPAGSSLRPHNPVQPAHFVPSIICKNPWSWGLFGYVLEERSWGPVHSASSAGKCSNE